MPETNDQTLWEEIVARIAREWHELPADERKWASAHALELARLQEELHRLFLDVDGEGICRDCHGDCCGHGKFHPTLANLLACLVTDVPVPEPDFSRDCPYLGPDGCLFPPGVRPFNCISFICDRIEDRLAPEMRERFYRLERKIRTEYGLFAGRYVGANMRGVLIRGNILDSYLARR